MKFLITSEYGVVESIRDGRSHMGIDLAIPMDTPLHSFCKGVVERVVDYGDTNIGKGVIIRAKDGARYIYGHMDKIDVHAGDTVQEGTLLGLSGSSGHSTGPHLHFGEMVDGHYIDPSPVIDKVDRMAGTDVTQHTDHANSFGWLSHIFEPTSLEDHVRDITQHFMLGVLSAAGSVALQLAYSVALIGGGILIVLKQLGFEHRWLKPSVLAGAYVLIRFLFGGS